VAASGLERPGVPAHDRSEALGAGEDRGEIADLDTFGRDILDAAHQTLDHRGDGRVDPGIGRGRVDHVAPVTHAAAPSFSRRAAPRAACLLGSGSRSLSLTNSGVARKIEEKVPVMMPTTWTIARSMSVPTPRIHTAITTSASRGRIPITVVWIDLIRVWLTPRFASS